MAPVSLTKKLYVEGRHCSRALWLRLHRKELVAPRTPFEQSLIAQGNSAGALARTLFAGGVLIESMDREQAIAQTRAAIESGAPAIFEGAFFALGTFVRVDVLKRVAQGWELYEVKGGSDSKDAKESVVRDIAVQAEVVAHSGVPLSDVFLIRLSSEYRLQGDLDTQKLFEIEPMKDAVAIERACVTKRIEEQEALMQVAAEPTRDLGSHCSKCDFRKHCWKDVPTDGVEHLPRAGKKLEKLRATGCRRIVEVPEDQLTDIQLRIQEAWRAGGEAPPKISEVAEYLSELRYPLAFLDFETMSDAIPRYEGTRPWQAMPWQFSLAVQRTPGAPVEWTDYLADGDTDPRPKVAEALRAALPESGSIIAWSATAERQGLLSLDLEAVTDRLWDLEVPFRKGWICRAEFGGRSSLKAVLPVLAPDLSYKVLSIADGTAALESLRRLREPLEPAERAKLRAALETYCRLDVEAMSRILEVISSLQMR